MKLEENYSLLTHNTFGMDVRARYFVEYQSVSELIELLQSDIVKQHPLLAIGGGSNLLHDLTDKPDNLMAVFDGLESAILTGDGSGEPIGILRHEDLIDDDEGVG